MWEVPEIYRCPKEEYTGNRFQQFQVRNSLPDLYIGNKHGGNLETVGRFESGLRATKKGRISRVLNRPAPFSSIGGMVTGKIVQSSIVEDSVCTVDHSILDLSKTSERLLQSRNGLAENSVESSIGQMELPDDSPRLRMEKSKLNFEVEVNENGVVGVKNLHLNVIDVDDISLRSHLEHLSMIAALRPVSEQDKKDQIVATRPLSPVATPGSLVREKCDSPPKEFQVHNKLSGWKMNSSNGCVVDRIRSPGKGSQSRLTGDVPVISIVRVPTVNKALVRRGSMESVGISRASSNELLLKSGNSGDLELDSGVLVSELEFAVPQDTEVISHDGKSNCSTEALREEFVNQLSSSIIASSFIPPDDSDVGSRVSEISENTSPVKRVDSNFADNERLDSRDQFERRMSSGEEDYFSQTIYSGVGAPSLSSDSLIPEYKGNIVNMSSALDTNIFFSQNYQVHSRMMGWKLTSLKKRKKLMKILDKIEEVPTDYLIEKSYVGKSTSMPARKMDQFDYSMSTALFGNAEPGAGDSVALSKREVTAWEQSVSRRLKAYHNSAAGKVQQLKNIVNGAKYTTNNDVFVSTSASTPSLHKDAGWDSYLKSKSKSLKKTDQTQSVQKLRVESFISMDRAEILKNAQNIASNILRKTSMPSEDLEVGNRSFAMANLSFSRDSAWGNSLEPTLSGTVVQKFDFETNNELLNIINENALPHPKEFKNTMSNEELYLMQTRTKVKSSP